MGLRDAARWLKEKIIGKKDAQEPQKEGRREESDISSEKDEKGPERAENEAVEDAKASEICENDPEEIWREAGKAAGKALRNYLKKIGQMDEESHKVFEGVAEKFAEFGMTAEKVEEAWKRATLILAELCSGMDKWQIEKLMMSNNERRRRGMPMVRRQQHLRNMRNQRRRRGKASYERREKP